MSARAQVTAVILAAAALRIVFWSHLWGSDDLNYANYAYGETLGWWTPVEGHNHQSVRKAIVLPTAVFYALLGVNGVSTGLWSFLCSLGLVALAHRFGRLMLGRERAALVTALLAAVFPLDIIFASVLWPTEPLAFFTGLGMYLFFRAEKADRPRVRAYVAAGVAIGVGYLVHPTALYLALFFAPYLAIRLATGQMRWAALAVAAGVGGVIFAEQVAYFATQGQWLYTFRVTGSSNLEGFGYIRNWEGTSQLIEGSALASFWIGPWSMALLNQEFALFYVIGLPAVIYAAFRGRTHWPVILWFGTQFVWLAYGTTATQHWLWLGRMPRYYAPVTLPLLIIIAWAIERLGQSGRRRLAHAALALLVVTGVAGAALDDGTNTAPIGEFTQRVLAEPDAGWATDHTTLGIARYYNGLRPLPTVRVLTEPPSRGGPTKHAVVQPFSLDGVDRFYYHPDNWDFAIRQPENCGSADKMGRLEGDCRADALLDAVRAWGPPERIDAWPRRWLCAPLAALGDPLPERLTAQLCAPRITLVYTKSG